MKTYPSITLQKYPPYPWPRPAGWTPDDELIENDIDPNDMKAIKTQLAWMLQQLPIWQATISTYENHMRKLEDAAMRVTTQLVEQSLRTDNQPTMLIEDAAALNDQESNWINEAASISSECWNKIQRLNDK